MMEGLSKKMFVGYYYQPKKAYSTTKDKGISNHEREY